MDENFIQATPFFSVRSVEQAVAFYRDRLGFTAHVAAPDYAYLGRGRAGLRLLIYTPDDGPFAPSSAYFDVRDVDAFVAEHSASWSDLPKKAVFGPVDQNYHQREVMIRDPDGNLVMIGQGIGPNARQWDSR